MNKTLKAVLVGLVLATVVALVVLQLSSRGQRPETQNWDAPALGRSPGGTGPELPAPGPSGEIKMEQPAMGTMVQYIVLGAEPATARQAITAAMAEVDRLAKAMTDYLPGSEVYQLNQSAGGPPVPVSAEVFEVIQRSLVISELSDGAFDITVGALKGVWLIRKDSPRVATAEQVREKLPLIDWRAVILDAERRTAGLKLPGMRVDLGGIAKGYIVDRAVAVLKSRGITMASVNAGGNLRLLGPHGNRPWNMGIQHPRDPENIVGWVKLTDQSIATSGDYENFIEVDGKRYCHIMDPRTGFPVSTVQSATVITAEAWRADGLSTAVFVLGPDKGMALLESLPGVEGVIIDADGRRAVSSGLQGRVNWID